MFRYTHYFGVKGWDSDEWQHVWPQLLHDVELILEASDVLIEGYPREDGCISEPVVDLEDGIYFNGVATDSHEPFILNATGHRGFCKTLQKPYDVAVACVLLRAYMLAPGNIGVGYI